MLLIFAIVEQRLLRMTQLRRLGDIGRAAYAGHIASCGARVISYTAWLRFGGEELPVRPVEDS